jgi:DNA-binding MarR family transcriptional regulator
MTVSSLRAVAEDYANHGLSTVVAFPQSKVPGVSWGRFAYEAPTEFERDAMFSFDGDLNIGFVCGVASQNTALIDAESQSVFIEQVKRFDRAGKGDTWMAETYRGGHISIRLPFPVAGYKGDGFEVRGQGQFVLLPPSIHPSGKQYNFLHRPDKIIEVSPADLPWLKLEPARTVRPIPRKAARLLSGDGCTNYETRSEAEQSIVTILFNAGFSFDETLALFHSHKAAGKFSALYANDPAKAVAWLKMGFEAARQWCVKDSPARKIARVAMAHAQTVPWPGRYGSTDRAVYLAHLSLAHQAGQQDYHASSRDVAEHAGCTRSTASRASKRLINAGFMRLVKPAAFTYANRYLLLQKGEDCTTPSPSFLRSGSMFTFSLSDCFRRTGLGRAAYEVLSAVQCRDLTVSEVVEKTGRSVQTVRKALHRMSELGFVSKHAKKWRGREISETELEVAARKLGTSGAGVRQKKKHCGERLRHQLQHRMRGIEQ